MNFAVCSNQDAQKASKNQISKYELAPWLKRFLESASGENLSGIDPASGEDSFGIDPASGEDGSGQHESQIESSSGAGTF